MIFHEEFFKNLKNVGDTMSTVVTYSAEISIKLQQDLNLSTDKKNPY